jgi:hypothetical protein
VNFYDGTGLPGEEGLRREVGQGDGRRHHLRRPRHLDRARDRRLLPRQQAEVHPDPDPGRLGDHAPPTQSGRCDAYSTDASALAAFRATQGPKAPDHVLLPEIISKEPLGAMVRKGDDKFFDIVRWTYFATLIAEEYGVTSANIDSNTSTNIPELRRLLGLEGDMGKALGVDNKWAYNAIKQVGNFGEIWDRNITPLGIPRGINNLWNKAAALRPADALTGRSEARDSRLRRFASADHTLVRSKPCAAGPEKGRRFAFQAAAESPAASPRSPPATCRARSPRSPPPPRR